MRAKIIIILDIRTKTTQKIVLERKKLKQYYSEYEQGNKTMPVSHLMELAEYYDVSLDYLVGLTDEKEPYTKSKAARMLKNKVNKNSKKIS